MSLMKETAPALDVETLVIMAEGPESELSNQMSSLRSTVQTQAVTDQSHIQQGFYFCSLIIKKERKKKKSDDTL